MKIFKEISVGLLINALYDIIIIAAAIILGLCINNLIFSTAIIAIFIAYLIISKIRFGVARFKWGHIHSYNEHIITFQNDGTAIADEVIKTIKNKDFTKKLEGYYDWNDVTVTKVEMSSENSKIHFNYTDAMGQLIAASNNAITITGGARLANYYIDFTNNDPEDIKMKIHMVYDKNMKPEYYVEVMRPIKKLVIELKIHNDVSINDICKEVYALYGDKKDDPIVKKELKGKPCKNEPNMTRYTLKIRNPKILHRYQIRWKWI